MSYYQTRINQLKDARADVINKRKAILDAGERRGGLSEAEGEKFKELTQTVRDIEEQLAEAMCDQERSGENDPNVQAVLRGTSGTRGDSW